MNACARNFYRTFSVSLCSDVINCLNRLPLNINKELISESDELEHCSQYLIDGRGKAVRPTIVLLMGAGCNYTVSNKRYINPAQETVAMVSEMIHTASLIHDDIIDGADSRRGRLSVNKIWGERKAVQSGNFILSQASRALANCNNPYVIDLLTNVIEDLVQGEVMQVNSIDNTDSCSMFDQYIEKTFKKTASLMAYSCQAVAVLSGANEKVCNSAFQYGRCIGLAFQIIDDVLDFRSTQSIIGKPTLVDLKLGIATAPVLFAARKCPDLYDSIKNNFSSSNDIQSTIDAVNASGAIEESRQLALEYSEKAINHITDTLNDCPEKEHLCKLAHDIVHRTK